MGWPRKKSESATFGKPSRTAREADERGARWEQSERNRERTRGSRSGGGWLGRGRR
ncbi:hypothetical protein ACIPRL_08160 [Streptomyces sp. NPDC090085]|uniref:hypothetical protein n=1 Tax=Streptomyces sp. NPDC090085 TaxID=3365943 RepID=UPI00380A7066